MSSSLISAKGENALYKKIERYLVDYIKTNNLNVDDNLPPEREIGRVFKASQIPVRRAILNLVAEGTLKQIPGKGAVVNKNIHITTTTGKIGVLYCHKNIALFRNEYFAEYAELQYYHLQIP